MYIGAGFLASALAPLSHGTKLVASGGTMDAWMDD